jgi:transcriptional regulator with XRE-family HTH domain
MITAEQCRAARALLDWGQADLAEKAGVGIVTVRQLEAGSHDARRATLQVIRHALELAGVEFIDENGGGPGVRLRKAVQEKELGRVRLGLAAPPNPFIFHQDMYEVLFTLLRIFSAFSKFGSRHL